MPTAQQILYNAALDLRIVGVDHPSLPDEYTPPMLSKLNRLISNWNAMRVFGQYEYTQVFTLPASPTLSPNGYSIGATGDSPKLVVTAGRAPVLIDSAKRVDSTGYETPIRVMSFQEWDSISTPGLTNELTLAVYLQTKPLLPILWCYGFAVGELIRLSWKHLVNTVLLADIGTNINFQDGFENALTLTLTEDCAEMFGKSLGAKFMQQAREAREAVAALNGLPVVLISDSPFAGRSITTRADFLARNI